MSGAGPLVACALAGGVLTATINRPEKRNALSRPLLAELRRVFTEFSRAPELRVAVLRGAGERSFAAGGDLRDLAAVRTPRATRRMAGQGRSALEAIRDFPVPVVAALNGDALGGGAELALACDFRIACAHARIGFIHGRLNIATAWGGGADLMRLVGPARALRLLVGAERLDARAAQAAGLLDEVGAPGEPLDALVERFIAPFLRQRPQVLRAFKALARAFRKGASAAALREIESRGLVGTWVHPDHWRAAEAVLDTRRRTT